MPARSDPAPPGAHPAGDGVHFRVWAPLARQVTVAFEDAARAPLTLAPEPAGYFSGTWPGGTAGALYRYRLDERGPYPDPCSYYQPRGPHGASMVVDPAE